MLYDQGELVPAADKLAEALARPGTPTQAKPLLILAQRLEAARAAGNAAFKRGDWAAAASGYTRGLQVWNGRVGSRGGRGERKLQV